MINAATVPAMGAHPFTGSALLTANRQICVIIPTYNRVGRLRTLLRQLLVQVIPKGYDLLPLVINDGSPDETEQMLRTEFPSISFLTGPGRWWWTKSVNEGMKYALMHFHPDYFLLLNDDSQLSSGYMQELMKASEKAGANSIIASLSVNDTLPHQVSFSGIRSINWRTLKKETYHKNFELLEQLPSSGLVPTYALNGRGTPISAGIIQKLGFLNERSFPQYGSDDDLALRAWEKGILVLLSYSCHVYDSLHDTSRGNPFRQDPLPVFIKSFFTRHSVNYIPKQFRFFYRHGIRILLPFYMVKFIGGTAYAYFFKYKKPTP